MQANLGLAVASKSRVAPGAVPRIFVEVRRTGMPTPAELLGEIQSDPESLGYATLVATGSDQGVADLLNARTISGSRPVRAGEVRKLAIDRGVYGKLELAARTVVPQTDDEKLFLAVVLNVLALMKPPPTSGDEPEVYFVWQGQPYPPTELMLGALQQGGILTLDDRAALEGLAACLISRAEQLWGLGTAISGHDVAAAHGRS
jgi:hypothetical protein